MSAGKLLDKLEGGIASLRQTLEENDGSTLKTLKTSAIQGFESVKDAFSQNEKAQSVVNDIRKHLDDLEEAVKKGDRELSDKFLGAAERKLKEYKEKHCFKQDGTKKEPPKQIDEPPVDKD